MIESELEVRVLSGQRASGTLREKPQHLTAGYARNTEP
jgi:hypothetical protein